MLVGIDVGTTGVKAVAFDVAGSQRFVSTCPSPVTTSPGRNEQSPESMLHAVQTVLSELVRALQNADEPIDGIGVTGQGEASGPLTSRANHSTLPFCGTTAAPSRSLSTASTRVLGTKRPARRSGTRKQGATVVSRCGRPNIAHFAALSATSCRARTWCERG